jgi:hypothetical protein
MHEATCPTCGTHVELDFKPVAGLVWCPKCQRAFSQSGGLVPEPQEPEGETNTERDWKVDDDD